MAIRSQVSGRGVVSRVASQGPLNWKALAFARPKPWKTCIWLLPWHFFTAPLRGWRCNSRAYVNRLTPTGDAASAISKLGCVGSKGFSTRDAHCSPRFHSFPKTDSRASPLSKLSKITMTKSGSLASVLYPVWLDLLAYDSLRCVRQSGSVVNS